MVGHPSEGEEEFGQTISLLTDSRPDIHQIVMAHTCMAIRDTKLARGLIDRGWSPPTEWDQIGTWLLDGNDYDVRLQRQKAVIHEANRLGISIGTDVFHTNDFRTNVCRNGAFRRIGLRRFANKFFKG